MIDGAKTSTVQKEQALRRLLESMDDTDLHALPDVESWLEF